MHRWSHVAQISSAALRCALLLGALLIPTALAAQDTTLVAQTKRDSTIRAVAAVDAENIRKSLDSLARVVEQARTALVAAQDSIGKLSRATVADRARVNAVLRSTLSDIAKKQKDIIATANDVTQRFFTGAKSVDVILGAIVGSLGFAQLATPFVSPQFQKDYSAISKYRGWLPALTGLGALLVKNGDASKQNSLRISIVSLGAALYGLTDLKPNPGQLPAKVDDYLSKLNGTIALLNFNATVFHDAERVKAMATAAQSADKLLGEEYEKLANRTSALNMHTADQIMADSAAIFKTLDSVLVFGFRLQSKIAKTSDVWDEFQILVSSYTRTLSDTLAAKRPYFSDVKTKIETVKATFDNNREKWIELKEGALLLPAGTVSRLNSFSELSVLASATARQLTP